MWIVFGVWACQEWVAGEATTPAASARITMLDSSCAGCLWAVAEQPSPNTSWQHANVNIFNLKNVTRAPLAFRKSLSNIRY